MAKYREQRNIEASIIDHLKDLLSGDAWAGIRVEKLLAQVYEKELPAILINTTTVDTKNLEIGNKTHLNYYTIYFRIFATNDGNRLDLTDWLLNKLEDDIDYYEYTITNGTVSAKVFKGKITILRIMRNEKEFISTENLDKEDRYRQLITVQCYLALV